MSVRRPEVTQTCPGQRGVALVTALLVVSLATMAAVAMATRQHVDVRRTANLLHGEQAYSYAVAAETWAQVILQYDADDSDYDNLDEDWATSISPLSVEGGAVTGRIHDMQGRFNVNNLILVAQEGGAQQGQGGDADTEAPEEGSQQEGNAGTDLAYFKRLLTVLELDETLTSALLDWLDANIDVTSPDGAEDQFYLALDVPYRAANQPLISVSELRLVKGFTLEVMEALEPHITVLPEYSAININTATPVVLEALNAQLTESDVAAILEAREDGGYASINDFLALNAMAGISLDIQVDVKTDWFRVSTDVVVGDGRATLQSLLKRDGASSEVIYRVRSRERQLPPA